jgi:hypothetical protein
MKVSFRTVRHIYIAAHPTLKPKQCKRACLATRDCPTKPWTEKQEERINFGIADKLILAEKKIDVR